MYEFIGTGLNTFKDLKDKVIVEVGSGRGGGLEYLTRTKNPSKSIGVDFSQIQVDFCNQAYHLNNLKYIQGDSEHLDELK